MIRYPIVLNDEIIHKYLIVKMLESEEKTSIRAQTKSDVEKTRVFEIYM